MKTARALSESLRAAGHRITKARSALVEIFSHAPSPLSALQLMSELEHRSLRVNKTTVYRELEFLMSKGILRQIDLLDGKKHYEIAPANAHHHHLVCSVCGSVQCIELPMGLSGISGAIRRTHGFEVVSHVLEFFGTCRECRTKRRSGQKR